VSTRKRQAADAQIGTTLQPPGKVFRSRRLRKPSGRKQVAAVCYRVGSGGIEFLLVQTGGGRWIFPKGGVKPGLTHAQSAALEAFEEAGVHGRIEQVPFGSYSRRNGKRETTEPPVHAHLCQVTRLVGPQESNRKPTWFTAERAKRRLRADRGHGEGDELARLVDRALARVERLCVQRGTRRDALNAVPFEALEIHDSLQAASLLRYIRHQADARTAEIEIATNTYLEKLRQNKRNRELIGVVSGFPLGLFKPRLLGPGSPQKVQFIDSPRNLPLNGRSTQGKK
jgi:8-oxo-dGTP pyrophosphatase MutT (NUDIX family)